MKKLVSLFLVLALLFSAALAEDAADESVEEIVEDVMLDDEEEDHHFLAHLRHGPQQEHRGRRNGCGSELRLKRHGNDDGG